MGIEIGTQAPPLQVDGDGVIRVGNTRVTLDSVVKAFRNGATAEEICQQFSSIALADAYAAIAYYLRHQDRVDAYLESRREQAARVRTENESRSSQSDLRDRLLARREKGK